MAIEKKPWQRLLYEIWDAVVNNGGGGGGTLDVGDLLAIQRCGTDVAVNDEYYPDSNYESISRISYESTELVSSYWGISPENGIASGLTIVTPPNPIIVETITFFKLTVESNIITAVDDITDDVDFSVIDEGEGYFTIQLVIPSSELFSENEYFAISYSVND